MKRSQGVASLVLCLNIYFCSLLVYGHVKLYVHLFLGTCHLFRQQKDTYK
jgi:hypothetical protein